MPRKEPYNPNQGRLFSDSELEGLIRKDIKDIEKAASTGEQEPINNKENYGFRWKWLFRYYTGEQAENCLWGYMNIKLPHEVMTNLTPAYIASLYRGSTLKKRAAIKDEDVTYSSSEELIAKLIFAGSKGFLRDVKYEKIYDKVTKNLAMVPKEIKDIVVESFEKPYRPSIREEPGGDFFYDDSVDIKDPEKARRVQLQQFFRLIKDMYIGNTRKEDIPQSPSIIKELKR